MENYQLQSATVEEALALLNEWVSSKTRVLMAFYGEFFVAFFVGALHPGEQPDTFAFAAVPLNSFQASIMPRLSASIRLARGDRATVFLEHGPQRIALQNVRPEAAPFDTKSLTSLA
jgi:hypothetical protein